MNITPLNNQPVEDYSVENKFLYFIKKIRT